MLFLPLPVGLKHSLFIKQNMSQAKTVVAFDIGIRNLAWCIMKKEGEKISVLGWENYDLLAGDAANAPTIKEKCCACSAKPVYQTQSAIYCARHCSNPLRDVSGSLLRSLPMVKQLKEILVAKCSGQNKIHIPASKSDLVKELQKHFAMPIVKEKKKKAVDTELTVIHDAIRTFISDKDRQPLFHSANEILLENQPVLKNPTMKSVQILLFASLRDILQPSPPTLRLVHAKKKVEAAKGDAGYKERKQGSEDRVAALLSQDKVQDSTKWKAHLEKYKKKNDLTDAFCMCMDSLV
jgi:hypothetical protein